MKEILQRTLKASRIKDMPKHANNKVVITIESKNVVRILILVVITLLALSFFKNISHPLKLILISGFLALALNPAVSWIASKLKRESRAVATGTAYVLVITFLVVFFSIVIPPLIRQTNDFIRDVPGKITSLTDKDSSTSRFIERYQLHDEIDNVADNFKNKFSDISQPAIATANAIGTTIVSTIVVFVLTFMMLIEGPMWIERILSVQPEAKRDHRRKLAQRMYRVVVGYVNGQVLVAILGGIFATITLFIVSQLFDVQINAIALGGIVGLFALLPLIGTFIGSTIVVIACLLVSPVLALTMAIYFIIYQQIENVTIQPYIQAKTNDLTPLIVFIAALVGVGFGGLLGAFLAIPTAGCIKVLVEDHYENIAKRKAHTS